MSATPAARFLAEWGSRPTSARPGLPREDILQVLRRSPEEELADQLAEAVARGRTEGRAAAEREAETRLSQQREAADSRLITERERWSQTEADRLAELIAAGLAALETRLAGAVARILRPRLTAERREQALDAFAESVKALLGRGAPPIIRLEGPGDLVEALRERLGTQAAALDCISADRPELRLLADDTVIESRLTAWAACLAEAPHG